jgi:hypothetical protein
MKNAWGLLRYGVFTGFASWGSYAVLHGPIGWWSYLPAVVFGVIALYLLLTGAISAIVIGTDDPEQVPRPLRRIGPYAFPAIMGGVLIGSPIMAVYRTEHTHGAGQVLWLIVFCFAWTLCAAMYLHDMGARHRRGREPRSAHDGEETEGA